MQHKLSLLSNNKAKFYVRFYKIPLLKITEIYPLIYHNGLLSDESRYIFNTQKTHIVLKKKFPNLIKKLNIFQI